MLRCEEGSFPETQPSSSVRRHADRSHGAPLPPRRRRARPRHGPRRRPRHAALDHSHQLERGAVAPVHREDHGLSRRARRRGAVLGATVADDPCLRPVAVEDRRNGRADRGRACQGAAQCLLLADRRSPAGRTDPLRSDDRPHSRDGCRHGERRGCRGLRRDRRSARPRSTPRIARAPAREGNAPARRPALAVQSRPQADRRGRRRPAIVGDGPSQWPAVAGAGRGRPGERAGAAARACDDRRAGLHGELQRRALRPRSLDAEGELEMAIVDGSGIARRLGLSDAHAPLLNGVAASGRARFAWPPSS